MTIAGYTKRQYDIAADPVLDFDAFVFSRRPFAHDEDEDDEEHEGDQQASPAPRAAFIPFSKLRAPPKQAKPTIVPH